MPLHLESFITEDKPAEKEIFHVHTYRCKHASDEESIDAEVEEAAKLIMMISDSKLRRAAIEQIRVLANM